ncbi:hypothetical protein Pfo_023293 [Paulownia fortunei]|nr:hypothetical protein Pfo_023293 [Paulownia fortunei]
MAKASSKISIFLNFAMALTLLLMIITMAESRSIFGVKTSSKLSCDTVVGVKSEDTCFGIAKAYNLTETVFDAINPNLNCTALFVGQWLCVDGFIN